MPITIAIMRFWLNDSRVVFWIIGTTALTPCAFFRLFTMPSLKYLSRSATSSNDALPLMLSYISLYASCVVLVDTVTATTAVTPMTMLNSVSVARPGRLFISRSVNFQRTIFRQWQVLIAGCCRGLLGVRKNHG